MCGRGRWPNPIFNFADVTWRRVDNDATKQMRDAAIWRWLSSAERIEITSRDQVNETKE
jgi:hypothetical protein